MLAAPCLIALRGAQKSDEEAAALEIEMPPVRKAAPKQIPLTLQELAAQAEEEAIAAQNRAEHAHWAALAATAKAAALRADAAAEVAALAGMEAERAIQAAEAEADYLPGSHPSLDFPRSRARHRAA
jgi:hypothetical protein